MRVSYNWLNKYFDGKLPSAERLEEVLTFHAWEIDEMQKVGNDTVLDVKVLPDKSMWALSHRGIAKDISVILNLPMSVDPLTPISEVNSEGKPEISINTDACRRFAAARINGVKVGPSPVWLKEALETIGQRSINNIVDASNYVMFDIGQPSHAFDAKMVGDKGFLVRQANDGEKLIGLDEVEYEFTSEDALIARGDTNEVLSIAGIKGGINSGINESTTDVIVEVANWNPVMVRKTGQRLKLRTDASTRYENGVVPEMVPYGLEAVVSLIKEVAGGEVLSYSQTIKSPSVPHQSIKVTISKINSVLGVNMTSVEVGKIMDRFGWKYEMTDNDFIVTPPFERTDLVIPEDVIEEIGRVYGYGHVTAITPEPVPLSEINSRFFYTELIRETLMKEGFSEIYTSSFRAKDEVRLANAFASDKGYLRSNLSSNMVEALVKNAPNADVLGVNQIRLFEIGTVFTLEGERLMLALGVHSPSGYKPKADEPVIKKALDSLTSSLGVPIVANLKEGVVEIDLGFLLEKLPPATNYSKTTNPIAVTYKPFSNYPSMSRDIALWVSNDVPAEEVESALNETAGELRVRTTLFDRFEKDGRVSYAFRLVFQANDRTLTDTEINTVMDKVYTSVAQKGWEVR